MSYIKELKTVNIENYIGKYQYNFVIKYLQTIAIIHVFFFILGLSYHDAISQEDCNELPPEIEAGCGNWTYHADTRSFPITSGCTITFNYWTRHCTESFTCGYSRTIVQFRFSSIDIPDNCYAVNNQLYPGWPSDFSTINNYYFNQLIDGIFLQLGKDEFVKGTIINCIGTPPDCNMPEPCGTAFAIRYSLPKCRAYCIANTPDTAPVQRKVISTITCPNTPNSGCCQHEKYFCNCGGEIYVTEINTYTSVTCNPTYEPEMLCIALPGWTKTYISCSDACDTGD